MMFIYGTRVFTKNMGYYGTPEVCNNCQRYYSPSYIRQKVWIHFDYIPLFPVKTHFYKMCPICGAGFEINKNDAKQIMLNKNETQKLYLYVRHVLRNKPDNSFKIDMSYELWRRDLLTGEEFCIFTGLIKSQVKNIKKNRCLKKLDIIDYN